MNRVNLIPLHRRQAKARRARVRAWTVFCGVYAVVLLAAGVSVAMLCTTPRSAGAEIAKLQEETKRATRQLSTVQLAAGEAQKTLLSARAVADQPDWSALLAVLSQLIGDNLVLNRCDVTPVKEERPLATPPAQPIKLPPGAPPVPAQQPAQRPPTRVFVHIAGFGRSQAAVAQFVLALEGTNLFERVTLIQTNRREFLSTGAVAFELDCPLRGRLGGTP
jgi:Tfp pilus assembly protein PilN